MTVSEQLLQKVLNECFTLFPWREPPLPPALLIDGHVELTEEEAAWLEQFFFGETEDE